MQVTLTSYGLNVHMTALCFKSLMIFSLNLHPVCAVNVLQNNEQILDHFFQTVVLASNNFMKL